MPASTFELPASILQNMLTALRYYWLISKGYRLRPWKSPYLQWRMETFFGPAAANLTAGRFLSYMWKERARLRRFLAWVEEMRREASRRSHDLDFH
ncbi:MAG TPA: hypothetical protein VN745_04835 [Verrucomicrobiae bacterium]|nr:hypothetical protein [Verrucomicrobiae bacterium]